MFQFVDDKYPLIGLTNSFWFQVEGKLSRKLQGASKLAQIQQITRQENEFANSKMWEFKLKIAENHKYGVGF